MNAQKGTILISTGLQKRKLFEALAESKNGVSLTKQSKVEYSPHSELRHKDECLNRAAGSKQTRWIWGFWQVVSQRPVVQCTSWWRKDRARARARIFGLIALRIVMRLRKPSGDSGKPRRLPWLAFSDDVSIGCDGNGWRVQLFTAEICWFLNPI